MALLKTVSLLCFFLLFVNAQESFARQQRFENLTWEKFADILEEIPNPKKYYFVKKHFLLGYDIAQEKPINTENLDSDEQLSVSIFFVITADEARDPDEYKQTLLSGTEVCFPEPIGCIDSGDAGLRP